MKVKTLAIRLPFSNRRQMTSQSAGMLGSGIVLSEKISIQTTRETSLSYIGIMHMKSR